jgi:uncharacterized protein (TIGR02996 family)
LRLLDLVDNQVGAEGAAALARSPHLGSLVELVLASNLIGGAGARALGASTTLRSLRKINLYNNGVDEALAGAVTSRFHRGEPPSSIPAELLVEPARPAPLPEPPPLERTAGPRDEQGLLAAIADAPDDELARRAYADWLEETGQSDRAALLRLACDMQSPGCGRDEGRALRAQSEAAARRLTKGWLAPVVQAGAEVRFPDGLPRGHVTMRTFLSRKFQDRVKDWIRPDRLGELAVTGTTSDWAKAADNPLLAGLGYLSLEECRFNASGLASFLSSPHLAGLHTLVLWRGTVSRRETGELAKATTLSRLRKLRIKVQFFLESDLRQLAGWPQLATVRGIDLSDCFLDGREVHSLLCSPHLKALTHLRLGQNRLGDTGAAALGNSAVLASLTHLDLLFNHLTDRAVAALVDSPYLGNLRVLWLGFNAVTDEGARLLASSRLDKLLWLILSSDKLTDAGRKALRDRFGNRLVLW